MATGTGLPGLAPSGGPVLATPPPVSNADSLSSAAAWGRIAAAGEKIANAGLDTVERDTHLQMAGATADFEVNHRDWYVRANDEFRGDPVGFENAARAHNDGAMSELPSWLVPHAKSYLGGQLESGLASQLTQKRADDDRLAAESLQVRGKQADSDVISLAMAGKGPGTPEFDAALSTYHDVLTTAVNSGTMSQDKADSLRDDLSGRAQGEIAARHAVDTYSQKGYGAAVEEAKQNILENPNLSLGPSTRRQIFNRAISALNLQQKEDREGQAAVIESSKDLRARLDANQDVDAGEVNDTLRALQRTGAGNEFARLNAKWGAWQATAPFRLNGGPSINAFSLQVAQMRGDAVPIDQLLSSTESGNRPGVVNKLGYAGLFQFGAPRLADLGVYKPGPDENLGDWSNTPLETQGKWSGTFSIPGFPDVKNIRDFLANPDAQRAAFKAHVGRMDTEISAAGLDAYEGQTIAGVPITRSGLYSMIHLAGAAGAKRVLDSGGQINPADANGTTALDYARMGVANAKAENGALPNLGEMQKEVQKVFVAQAQKSWPSVKQLADSGRLPDVGELRGYLYAAQLKGDPTWWREVEDTATAAGIWKPISTMSPTDAQAAVNRLHVEAVANGYDVSKNTVLSKVEGLLQRKQKMLADNPVGYAIENGRPAPDPFDFSSPENSVRALGQRVQLANSVAAGEGVDVANPLQPVDRAAIAGAVASGDNTRTVSALSVLGQVPSQFLLPVMSDDTIKAALSGAVRSYDPIRLNAAMGVLDRFWRLDNVGFRSTFDSATQDRLTQWQTWKEGMSPTEVAARFQHVDDPANVAARKKLGEQADDELKQLTLDKVAYQLGSSWGVSPLSYLTNFMTKATPKVPVDVPVMLDGLASQVLFAEYSQRYRDFRKLGFDPGQAKEKTAERIKEDWGQSQIMGGALMKFPPESYYQPTWGTHDWMRRQLETTIANIRGAQFPTDVVTPENAAIGVMPIPEWSFKALVSDAQTEAEVKAKKPPSYQIVVTNNRTGQDEALFNPSTGKKRFSFDQNLANREAENTFTDRLPSAQISKQVVSEPWKFGGPMP